MARKPRPGYVFHPHCIRAPSHQAIDVLLPGLKDFESVSILPVVSEGLAPRVIDRKETPVGKVVTLSSAARMHLEGVLVVEMAKGPANGA